MVANSVSPARRGTRPFPASVDSGDPLRSHVQNMARSLASLEEEVRAAQSLLRQLVAGLDQVLGTLDQYRQTLAALEPSQFGTGDPLHRGSTAANPHVRIYCLGAFEIYEGERPIPVHNLGKGCLIIKYLAATLGRPTQRDVLLEILWPGTEPAVANNRLKGAIHRVRRAIAVPDCQDNSMDFVRFDNGCYFFDPEISVWTDVLAFEQCWRMAHRLEKEGRLSEAITWYTSAEQLYRGDFLEEDRFDEWTLLRRENLLDRYLTLLDKIGSYWIKAGDPDRAIESWTKVLNKDPWREDAYRALMGAQAQRGNRSAALHWYEVCVQVLRDQLQIEPEPETQEIFRRIRTGRHPIVDH